MASITSGENAEKSLVEAGGLEVVEHHAGLEVAFSSNESESRINGLLSEADNIGLKILVEPIAHGISSNFGIILVHGIGGDFLSSWTADNSVCWPMDLLPFKVPAARIMSWGYNAKVVGSRSTNSTASIQGHSRGLLADINHYRGTRRAEEQKLIFIAHGIGGIIVQAALGESLMGTDNLYRNVAGVIFLGTPHRGLKSPGSLAILMRIFSSLGVITKSPMLKQLKPNSDALQHISMQFRKLLQKAPIEICSAFETRRTGSFGLIVDEAAATFGLPDEILIPLEADHRHLSKFSSERDINYIRISGIIQRWSNQVIRANLRQDDIGPNIILPSLPVSHSNDGIGPNTILPPLPTPRSSRARSDSDYSIEMGTPLSNSGNFASYIDQVFGPSGLESEPRSMNEDDIDEIFGPSVADAQSISMNGDVKGKSKMITSPLFSRDNLQVSGREVGEIAMRGIESASSAAADVTTGWAPSTVVTTVGGAVAGLALIAQGVSAVTARENLGVSREALAASRRAAIASGNSATVAKAALELNREVFEYNKAKDLRAGPSRPRRPGDDGDPGPSAAGSAPLGSGTFPSLAGVSPTFSGFTGWREGEVNDKSISPIDSIGYTIPRVQGYQGKGKGKEIKRDLNDNASVAPTQPAVPDPRDFRSVTNSHFVGPVRLSVSFAQLKPAAAKRTLFDHGFTANRVPSQPPSSQPIFHRADGLVSTPALPTSELQTAKAFPFVESSCGHSEAIAAKDMHEDVSRATEFYENHDEQGAESGLAATSKDDETKEQPKILASIILTERSVEKHEVEEEETCLNVDASMSEALNRDPEALASPKLDRSHLDVEETDQAPSAREKGAEEQVGFIPLQYGTKSSDEEKEQEVKSHSFSSQYTLGEKEDLSDVIACMRSSMEDVPPLNEISDTTVVSYTDSEDLALSELGEVSLRADKIHGTNENEPDGQHHLDHLDAKLRESQSNERTDTVHFYSKWGEDDLIQQPEQGCQSQIDEGDECPNSGFSKLQFINGMKTKSPLIIPSDMSLPGEMNENASMASEIDVVPMTEAHSIISTNGEERDTQLCLVLSDPETEYQMDEGMMDVVYIMSQQQDEPEEITANPGTDLCEEQTGEPPSETENGMKVPQNPPTPNSEEAEAEPPTIPLAHPVHTPTNNNTQPEDLSSYTALSVQIQTHNQLELDGAASSRTASAPFPEEAMKELYSA